MSAHSVLPGAAGSPLRITPAQAVGQSLTLARRGAARFVTAPADLANVVLTPVIFLLMFAYLFGGAISGGDTDAYLRLIVPGIMVMTVFQASVGVGAALSADLSTGVFDRLRTMPIARSAPLAGAVLADVVRYLISLGVLLALALVMGYRIDTGPLETLTAVAVLIAFALSFSWLSVFLGMLVATPGAVHGLMTILILPLTFASNVFVSAQTMPGWLEAWSSVNPVSLMADTVRGLLGGGEVAQPMLGSLAWMAGIGAVFLPLAMAAYRKKVK
ncbi:ABC transporter permease [Jiangella alkaliphila]|uniref:Transport permease protein n=1 Tax=Jiangella alkaliphila TaxID=419479 RepID=A0A1H2K1N1_9ACTN|nr:ABC transporter permease [Jiangella alkaliphila]SDU62607.1 oleandomycin transport system permease protein [Jiangella alkaliphila]